MMIRSSSYTCICKRDMAEFCTSNLGIYLRTIAMDGISRRPLFQHSDRSPARFFSKMVFTAAGSPSCPSTHMSLVTAASVVMS